MKRRLVLLVCIFPLACGGEKEKDGETTTEGVEPQREKVQIVEKEYTQLYEACNEGKSCEEFAELGSAYCERDARYCGGYSVLIHYVGATGKIDLDAARAGLIRGCDVGRQVAACTGERGLFNDAWTNTLEHVQPFLEAACKNKNRVACGNLSLLLMKDGSEVAAARAAELSKGACDAKIRLGCLVEGVLMFKSGNLEQARPLAVRGCELGSAAACWNIAGVLSRGQGGPADEQKAKEFATKACENGHEKACEQVGMLAPSIGVKSHPKAELLHFNAHETGKEQKRIKGNPTDAFVEIVKRSKLLVSVKTKNSKDVKLGKFERSAAVEALIDDGKLYVMVYETQREGKILKTSAARFALASGSPVLDGKLVADGRANYKKAAFVAP